MLNERMVGLGTQRSVIRELFEFGKIRAAEVGAENIFDFSIGNPSVAAPDCVNETAMRLIKELDPVVLHGRFFKQTLRYAAPSGKPVHHRWCRCCSLLLFKRYLYTGSRR